MKKYNKNTVKVEKKQTAIVNGKKTNIFEVRELKDNSWVFAGQFSGKTFNEAYESFLNA